MIRKLISFVFPFTRIVKSEYSGNLELTTIFGKTYLNTANTNYSYGSLQKVLKFSLKQVDVSKADHILVLGLGGGSVLKTLRTDFNYAGRITAVDIDPVIIEIAKNEFGVFNNENTSIVCTDALDYLKGTDEKFYIILIDLFIDNAIPYRFLSEDFWQEAVNSLKNNGTIIFNMLRNPPPDIYLIEGILRKNNMVWNIFKQVMSKNDVLIAKRSNAI